MTNLRWAVAGVLACAWLICAASNAALIWRRRFSKEKTSASLIPLAGGVSALVAMQALPMIAPEKKFLAALAMIALDAGSGYYVLLLIRVFSARRN